MVKSFVPKDEDKKCAPTKTFTHDSCFSIESLVRMAQAWNEQINKKKFKGKLIEIKQSDKKHLVLELTDRLSDVCDDQICWLKQDFINELKDLDAQENTFRPQGPQGRFTWLNTTNINEIMEQYQSKYLDYKFYGAIPIDFDEIQGYGIRDLDFDKLVESGTKRIGFVFNFDEHWQSGSHWVAMFADLIKGQIYYFDSYGTRPKKRIRNLVNRIGKWYYDRHIEGIQVDADTDSMTEASFMNPSKLNYIEKKIKTIKFNQNRHQFKNSECGVYSINFILRLLKGETFEYICDNITLDDEVNKCRETYFRFK
jgi:hypothetical protein